MFTKRAIDALAHDPNGRTVQIARSAGEPPGFGVRAFPSGVRSYVLDYRTLAGRARRLTLGKHGAITLQQARDIARDALAVVRRGLDPMEQRSDARRAITLREFALDVYLERHAKVRKRSWREDKRRLNGHVLPTLGSRKLVEVKRADIARLHADLGARAPFESNRVLALIAVIYTKAAEWGYTPEGAANPAANVHKFTEASRERWVTPEELPALWDAIEAEANPVIAAMFKLYLLTGMRRNELLSLRWDEVNLSGREVRLAATRTKSAKPHVVALSEPAAAILSDLPRRLGNPYVLPGHRQGRPFVNVGSAWRRIRRRAKLEDVRLHDLRRTVGSWMATAGESLPLIGKVLGHGAGSSATAVYARIAEQAPRAAIQKHGERIDQVARGARAQK